MYLQIGIFNGYPGKNNLKHLYMMLTLGLAVTVQKAILETSWTQCTATIKATNKTLVHTRKGTETEMESVTLLLCQTLLCPQTEHCAQFSSLHLKKGILE